MDTPTDAELRSKLAATVAARQHVELPSPEERRMIREAARLTQGNLAQVLATTGATISRWESGGREPTGDRRRRYAQVLKALEAGSP